MVEANKKTTTTVTTKPTVETPQDVPLFLRKTYHMIDSCDPSVACWSEDGETFVVKDPSKFESEIIPQFFKHSKFTSFVRQLNFYSFRKIKYVDTIRLDPKLEAETANFWRFRHEKFQRGKPHLLTEIKRMNGHKNTGSAAGGKKGSAGFAAAATGENSTEMKQELDTLKKRIEEMNKNMTELTSMVQKVTLKPASEESAIAVKQEPVSDVPVGAKRKKMDMASAAVPDSVGSTTAASSSSFAAAAMPEPVASAAVDVGTSASAVAGSLIQPDEMLSSALEFEEVLPMLTDDPTEHLQGLTSSHTAASTLDSATGAEVLNAFSADDALVDLCHHSLDDTTMELDTTATGLLPDPSTGEAPASSVPIASSPAAVTMEPRTDRADPVLMDRLSEALAVLPKEMQEQIVERLIAAITTTDLFAPLQQSESPKAEKKETLSSETQQPQRQQQQGSTAAATTAATTNAAGAVTPEVGMPLAAATLAALLSHYSAQVKKSNCKDGSKDNASQSGVKTIPVIPVHA